MLVFDNLLDLSPDCLIYIRSISHKCDKFGHRNVVLMGLCDHSWHYFVSFSVSKKERSIECYSDFIVSRWPVTEGQIHLPLYLCCRCFIKVHAKWQIWLVNIINFLSLILKYTQNTRPNTRTVMNECMLCSALRQNERYRLIILSFWHETQQTCYLATMTFTWATDSSYFGRLF